MIDQFAVLELKALQAGNITVFFGFHYPDAAAVFCGCKGSSDVGTDENTGAGSAWTAGAMSSPTGAPERALLPALPGGAVSPLLRAASSSAHKSCYQTRSKFFHFRYLPFCSRACFMRLSLRGTEAAGCESRG